MHPFQTFRGHRQLFIEFFVHGPGAQPQRRTDFCAIGTIPKICRYQTDMETQSARSQALGEPPHLKWWVSEGPAILEHSALACSLSLRATSFQNVFDTTIPSRRSSRRTGHCRFCLGSVSVQALLHPNWPKRCDHGGIPPLS